jgi:hypothetical protein
MEVRGGAIGILVVKVEALRKGWDRTAMIALSTLWAATLPFVPQFINRLSPKSDALVRVTVHKYHDAQPAITYGMMHPEKGLCEARK